MARKTLDVSGMSCDGCEQNVENSLSALDSVTRVEADHEQGTVEVDAEDGVSEDELVEAVRDAGYEVSS